MDFLFRQCIRQQKHLITFYKLHEKYSRLARDAELIVLRSELVNELTSRCDWGLLKHDERN